MHEVEHYYCRYEAQECVTVRVTSTRRCGIYNRQGLIHDTSYELQVTCKVVNAILSFFYN